MKRDKTPHLRNDPSTDKSPRVVSDPTSYYELRPAWRIQRLELCDPFGWHQVDRETVDRIRQRLSGFESMTWREILVNGRKRNHTIKTSALCKKAQERLQEIGLDDTDSVLSLGLTGAERIWGLLSQGVLSLLWWDPEHAICPAHVKNT